MNFSKSERPYPHMIIFRVFPSELYERMIDDFHMLNLPDFDHPSSRKNGSFTRSLGRIDNREDIPQSFIEAMDIIRSENMIAELSKLAKLPEEYQLRIYGVEDRAGYSIAPHPDAPHKLVTVLFYLEEPNLHRDIGTSIYKKVGKRFREVDRAPFRPNSAFAFGVTKTSYHGVENITDKQLCGRPRRTIAMFIMKKDYQGV